MPEKIAVLGTGGWGTALSILLARNGHRVSMWGRTPATVEELRRTRENARYLPGVKIPETISITADGPADADLVVVAVPTQHIRSTLALPAGVPVVSVAKGIEMKTGLRPSEVMRELSPRAKVAVLSGPSHAEEVARGLPATVTVASKDEALARRIQKIFMGETFRVYTSRDVAGVEFGGALKNVIALGAGICDGLELGDNAKAALVSRGIVEIARLGVEMGAKRPTFFGVSGIGDLVTTCYSRHGRNLHVGREIGKGRSLPDVLAGMSMVAEGVWTCQAAREMARAEGVEVPITDEVCRVLHEGTSPREGVRRLMSRLPKSEADDWA